MKMTKRLICILLTLSILVSLFPAYATGSTAAPDTDLSASPEDLIPEVPTAPVDELTPADTYAPAAIANGTCGNNITWTLSDNGTLTISGTGDMPYYNPYQWTSYQDQIKKVVVNNGVTSIANGAFAFLGSLSSVTLPAGITSIGENSFYCCSSLTSITIPEGTTTIGRYAFYLCDILSSVYLPDSVTYIGERAFGECSSLSSIDLPNGLTTIATGTFYASWLETITIPSTVTRIEDYAFYKCAPLSEVNFAGSEALWNRISIGSGNSSLNYADIRYNCAETPSTSCGSNLTWALENGTLTISGTGDMYNYFIGLSEDSTEIILPPWYNVRDSIRSVVVHHGVTSIGDCAFQDCMNLTSVNLPESITYIGMSAFEECESLTSVHIPKNVTYIGSAVFWNCHSLTSVNIPEGVTHLGTGAFNDCTSLTSITIPGSLQFIETDTFSDCTALTSVTIHEGVTHVGDYAFSGCSSLTSITLPDSVKYIDEYAFSHCTVLSSVTLSENLINIFTGAFSDCTALTSIALPESMTSIYGFVFSGCTSLNSIFIPVSVTTIEAGVFESCRNLTDIYYGGSQAQWERISINFNHHYNDPIYDAMIHYNSTGLTKHAIPDGAYMIIVQNTNGEPISNALVVYGTLNAYTNTHGKVYFPKLTSGTPDILVNHDNYRPYSNRTINYEKSERNYEIITLLMKEESIYKLTSAVYQNTTFGTPTGVTTDLLTNTKRLSTSHTSSTGFQLTCRADNGGPFLRYKLYQKNRCIAESTTGVFSLETSSFSAGGNVFVRVISQDGISVDTPLNLIFVADSMQEEPYFSLGHELTFTIPASDDIPYFSGQTFTFDIPDLPLDIMIYDDAVYIGGNISLAEFKDGVRQNPATIKEQWEEQKNLIVTAIQKTLDYYSGTRYNNDAQKMVNFLLDGQNSTAKWGPLKAKVVAMGYGEGKFDENGIAEINVGMCVVLDVNKTVQGPTYVAFACIPVTYSIKVYGSGKVEVNGGYNIRTSTWHSELSLGATLGVDAFGGAGIGAYVGVGVYGNGSLDTKVILCSTDGPSRIDHVNLTADLGLKAYLGSLEWRLSWKKRTWYLYTGSQRTMAVNADSDMVASSAASPAALYDPANYTVSDLSYLKNESSWLGSSENYAMSSDTDPISFTTLLEGTYRNAQPVIGTADRTPVMVFTRGNTDRGIYNSAQLVYSVYTNKAWSTPVPVDSDNTGDSGASLFTASDGSLWLIYQNQSIAFDDSYSLSPDDYARTSTVVAARFDPSSKKFVGHTVLSSANTYASRAAIFRINGITTAVWVENTTNNYFGTNNSNSVWFAQYSNGSWGTARCITGGLNAITELAVGDLGGTLSIAIAIDSDNDLSTPDRTVNLLNLSGQLTPLSVDGESCSLQFAVLPGDSNFSLLWVENSTLKSYNGTTATELLVNSELADGFILISNCVLYRATVEGGSILCAHFYQNNRWGGAVQLSHQNGYIQSYAAVTVGATFYVAAVRADVTISDNTVNDDCDLCWAKMYSAVDIAVADVSIDHGSVAPNSSAPVTVVLQNNGTNVNNQATVEIRSANGSLLESETFFNLDLIAGTQKEVELTLPFGSKVSLAGYTVSVSLHGLTDVNTENDTKEFTTGYGDLIIDAEFVRTGSTRKIIAEVTNKGASPLGGTLYVSVSGKSPKEVDIPELAPGASTLLEIKVTSSLLGGKTESLVTLTAEADGEENSAFNNTVQIYATSQSAKTYTVSYRANGGTGTLPLDVSVVSGNTVIAAECGDLTNNGATFYGWNTAPDGSGTSYQPGQEITVTKNLTLFAMWSITNGLFPDANGVWWFYWDGVVQTEYTGLVEHSDGKWYYVSGGRIDFSCTGLIMHTDGTWYYISGGVLDRSYTGLAEYMGSWYYIEAGILNWGYTGLVLHTDGNWYYISGGILDFGYTGLTEYMGGWYYVEAGVLNWGYTGLTLYLDGNWYYVSGGVLDRGYTGLAEYMGGWYYVEAGVLNFGYTGLSPFVDGNWYYVSGGVLDLGYTGLAEYFGGWYYVEAGVLNWGYTGLTLYIDGNWYFVSGGVLAPGYTGLAEHFGAWYYIEAGVLNWGYTGLAPYIDGNWYYVSGGVLDWTYTGEAYGPDGNVYIVINGVVVF